MLINGDFLKKKKKKKATDYLPNSLLPFFSWSFHTSAGAEVGATWQFPVIRWLLSVQPRMDAKDLWALST